jgi:hypothetical protein
VPRWPHLTERARLDLEAAGLDAGTFEPQDDRLRLTVLNLYVKMRSLDLWPFVGRCKAASPGCLEFSARDVEALKRTLVTRWDFQPPRPSAGGAWSAMERRPRGALHLKHFAGWPAGRVQAHIDAAGLWLRHPLFWWAGLPVTGLLHLAAYSSYKDVSRLRALLLQQGADRDVLLGRAA